MTGAVTSRPIATAVCIAATALMVTVPPNPSPSVQTLPSPRVATRDVTLTSVEVPDLWALASGADPSHPLPVRSNPIAPVAQQFVANLSGYYTQLMTGRGAQIPGEVSTHLAKVSEIVFALPGLLLQTVIGTQEFLFAGGGTGAFLGFVVGSIPGGIIGAIIGVPVGIASGVLSLPVRLAADVLASRNDIATALAAPVSDAPAEAPPPTQATPVRKSSAAATGAHSAPRRDRPHPSMGAAARTTATTAAKGAAAHRVSQTQRPSHQQTADH
jgi:hypothetical protein